MKKSLIALAVMGLSGVAMAQSAVTLYGVADAGLGKTAGGKTHFIGAGLTNNGDSRVGVRGTEDLGGGLSAGFNFETGLSLNDGSTRSGNYPGGLVAPGANGFWQRQANMWLSGGWGTFKMGRQFTTTYLASSMYELTGLANYSVLNNTYANLGVLDRRAPSAFAYVSPSFSGLTAAIAYVNKNDLSWAALSKDAWDAALLYSGGPISAGLGINKLGNSKTNFQLGGKYNFGNFALAASYTSASKPDDKAVRRGFGLGGSATFGAFTATLDLTRDTKNEWGPKKYTNGVAEVKYALSKRSFVYADYLRLNNTNNWGIGLHHSF
jgi:predicted porin